METTNQTPARAITVEVNNQPVTFEVHKANGAQIKATAIAQGVQI